MRHGDKETGIRGALGGDANRSGNVRLRIYRLARDSAQGEVHSGMRKRAFALLAVEVLNQRGKGVEFRRGGVPADQDFFRGGFEVEFEHALLVVHVHFDLFGGFGVGDGIAVADIDFGAVF